ncbi:hypothetical protein T4B_5192 [Trichinella pseudospiralis]|uniref:Uncharacterized protein n=1 Tax=Trichinella pseudospiralis TaxID=6337 RepID=A0A0V1J842_TRIPS|nr:hypothetical protein T4B_5192 [Trichinella pseudospiralis]
MLPVRTAGGFWRQTCTTRQVGTQLTVVQQAVQSSLVRRVIRSLTQGSAEGPQARECQQDSRGIKLTHPGATLRRNPSIYWTIEQLEFRARAVTDVEAYNTSGSEPEDDD